MFFTRLCPWLNGNVEEVQRLMRKYNRDRYDDEIIDIVREAERQQARDFPKVDVVEEEGKIEVQKSKLVRERILLAKEVLSDELPICSSGVEDKPDLNKVRTRGAREEKVKQKEAGAREVLPIAPQIATLLDLSHWLMSHDKKDDKKWLPLNKLLLEPNLSAYSLDPSSWLDTLPKADKYASQMNYVKVDPFVIDAAKAAKLEEGLRGAIKPASYTHVFWSATMKVADQIHDILATGVDVYNPNKVREFIDKLSLNADNLQNLSIACDCSMLDYSRSVTTQIANFLILRRDHALSKHKVEVEEDDLQRLRAGNFVSMDLFPGGLRKEADLVKELRDQFNVERTQKAFRILINDKAKTGSVNSRNDFNKGVSNNLNKGNPNFGGGGRGNRGRQNNNRGGYRGSYNQRGRGRGNQNSYQNNQSRGAQHNNNNFGSDSQTFRGNNSRQPFRGNSRGRGGFRK